MSHVMNCVFVYIRSVLIDRDQHPIGERLSTGIMEEADGSKETV